MTEYHEPGRSDAATPRPRLPRGDYGGSTPDNFIQWKGTKVCMDVYCTCGQHSHFDGDFAYALRCPCGIVWRLGDRVTMTANDPTYDGVVMDLEGDPFRNI